MSIRRILAEEGLTHKSSGDISKIFYTFMAVQSELTSPRSFAPSGNEKKVLVGTYKDAEVKVAMFSDFITVDLAFGQVWHMWSNRVHWAEDGMVHVSGGFDENWRFGGVLGRGRTSAGFDKRLPIDADAVIPTAYGFKGRVTKESEESAFDPETGLGDMGSAAQNFLKSKPGW